MRTCDARHALAQFNFGPMNEMEDVVNAARKSAGISEPRNPNCIVLPYATLAMRIDKAHAGNLELKFRWNLFVANAKSENKRLERQPRTLAGSMGIKLLAFEVNYTAWRKGRPFREFRQQ